MDWKNIDLQSLNEIELDVNNMGSWPKPVKVFIAILVALLVGYLSFNLFVSDKIKHYKNVQNLEESLKIQFAAKYQLAKNADAYKLQMAEMEKDFSELLKKLPTQTETPGLLDDITYVGTTSGLTFKKINWEREVKREIYTELPLRLQVVGGYHEFGEFLGRVAALPRIVTLHNFTIVGKQGDQLELNLLAKTYRYNIDQGEQNDK
ncbi:type 4a pilus biogenesis protein PilO [Gayadomonas joobiniege]|uniref:type 4a pilus biogenesis protein PilO n=1 Tax=Gayadomonas joobiniege TaxID=1234606 RepID=UPI0003767179|nr:type 4a pilus biogenesis protein PilO [Gayadomonas joobiniege]